MAETEDFKYAGELWRTAVRQPDEGIEQGLGLRGNLRLSFKGLLKAVFEITKIIVTVKVRAVEIIADPATILELGADALSAGMAVLNAFHEKMRSIPYFVAIVLSHLDAPVTRERLLAEVTRHASQVAAGKSDFPFYLFVTRGLGEETLNEIKTDPSLDAAVNELRLAQYLDEDAAGLLTFRERHFTWGFGEEAA